MTRRSYGEAFGVMVYFTPDGRFLIDGDDGEEHSFRDHEEAVRFIVRQWVMRLFRGTRH